MPQQRISKRVIDGIKPASSEFTIWDSDLTGFGVRVRPNGAKSYIVMYRAGHGRRAPARRLTLAAVGKITPDEARTLARGAIGAVAHGRNPAKEKTDSRHALTVSDLAAAFLSQHMRPKRKKPTVEQYERALRLHILPEFGKDHADKLTRIAVASLHQKMQTTPAAANHTLAVIGSMYGFGQRRGYVPEGCNPATRIEKYPESGRERYLSTDELARLGAALHEAETTGLPWEPDSAKPISKHTPKPDSRRVLFPPSITAAVRLLLLTGARLREILHLKWEYLDDERGLLRLPDSKTGKKIIVLNAAAIAVLNFLPRVGHYVLPGDQLDKPRADLKRPWQRLVDRAGLRGVRLHDLRHTHASFGAGAGLSLPIIGKLLGHLQPSTTARYAHLDADPLRRASDHIGNTITAALNGAQKVADPWRVFQQHRAGQARTVTTN